MKTSTDNLPAASLLALADALRDAAACIRHWHDSGEDGMVVSASHVRELWEATEAYRAARAASPVTLEEALIVNAAKTEAAYYAVIWDRDTNGEPAEECQEALCKSIEAEIALADHARALAEKKGPGHE